VLIIVSLRAIKKLKNEFIPVADPTRLLFATWWMFILILTSFYTANLTAFLTKPQFTLPINNVQDIVRKGYQWITYKGRTIDFLLSQVSPLASTHLIFSKTEFGRLLLWL